MAAPALSTDCLGWVRTAGYAWATEDTTDTLVLRSETGSHTRYYIRQVRDRLRLTQADEDPDEERTVLFAAGREVLERFLFGLFGDDIREDLGLPFLELPWHIDALAKLRGIASDERVSTVLLMVGLDTTG